MSFSGNRSCTVCASLICNYFPWTETWFATGSVAVVMHVCAWKMGQANWILFFTAHVLKQSSILHPNFQGLNCGKQKGHFSGRRDRLCVNWFAWLKLCRFSFVRNHFAELAKFMSVQLRLTERLACYMERK